MNYQIKRNTEETQLNISLANNGTQSHINTGVGFLDHMLTLFTFHSGLTLSIEATGDTYVDDHHITEDIGIVIGQLLLELVKTQQSFTRYGCSYVPMDEALARTVVDISGRPYFSFNSKLSAQKVGTFDTELVEEFLLRGGNTHHEIEAIFKSFARALKISLAQNEDGRIPSSKGVIE